MTHIDFSAGSSDGSPRAHIDALPDAGREGAPVHIAAAMGPEGAPAHIDAVPDAGRGRAPAHIAAAMGPERAAAHIDAAIAEFAARQHGVMTLGQLRSLGLGDRAVRHRVRRGSLHRLHRGVFAVGHAIVSPAGRRLAVVLASGPGAFLSYGSAGAAWRFRPSVAAHYDVTVAVHRRGPAGVRVHCVRRLTPADVGEVDGVPVTSVPRTLIDLAAILDETRLERAVHEAEVLRILDYHALESMLAGAAGRRGTGTLRRVLGAPDPGVTRSDLEIRFLELCRSHELPTPKLNARVGGFEVDAVWATSRVVVELDGAAFHDTRRAFLTDRRRDAALAASGYVVVRLTWDRVTREAPGVASELRRILAMRGAPAHIPAAMGPERAPAHIGDT